MYSNCLDFVLISAFDNSGYLEAVLISPVNKPIQMLFSIWTFILYVGFYCFLHSFLQQTPTLNFVTLWILILFQTGPSFYVLIVQVFWKLFLRKWEIAHYGHFLIFPHSDFYHFGELSVAFSSNLKLWSANSVWNILKFNWKGLHLDTFFFLFRFRNYIIGVR